ncbi:MAG: hypothetical protein ACOCXG_00505 [Nanoarchaeota archaeon]
MYERKGIILEPEGKIGAIFNPGATEYDGEIILLPRIVEKGYTKLQGNAFTEYISHIRIAKSTDGINFKLNKEYFIKASTKDLDDYGAEDARVTKLGTEYLITYTAIDEPLPQTDHIRIGLATTKDFKEVKKRGIFGPNFRTKAGIIFPEVFDDNQIFFLFKNESGIEHMNYAYMDKSMLHDKKKRDEFWLYYKQEENIFLTKQDNEWEDHGVEPGPQPIKTEHGWLLLYSAISKKPAWSVGAMLLDLKQPHKILAKTKKPIIIPKEGYEERGGDVDDVIFPEGVIDKFGKLFLYYGASDKYCCLATIDKEFLIEKLLKYNEN